MVPNAFGKYLKIFTKLFDFQFTPQIVSKWDWIQPLILENMTKLNSIEILSTQNELPSNYESFVIQLFQNSRKTLSFVDEPKSIIPDFELPQIETISLYVNANTQVHEFENKLQKAILKFKEINCIQVWNIDLNPKISNMVKTNYPNHCLTCSYFLQSLPTKIAGFSELNLEWETLSQLEYVIFQNIEEAQGWDNYKEFLNLCTNLKGVSFCIEKENSDGGEFECLTEEQFPETSLTEIWKERISYVKSLGLKVGIFDTTKFLKKYSKKYKVNWWFDFRYSY